MRRGMNGALESMKKLNRKDEAETMQV